jgi:hypothetical protein
MLASARLENGLVVNCAVMGLASRRPLAERTVTGTVTVTRVDGLNGMVGTNISVSPVRCQLPGTLGLRAGHGDFCATGAEKVTWTGSTPCFPSPGTTAHPALSVACGLIVVTQRQGRGYPTRRPITRGRREREVTRP